MYHTEPPTDKTIREWYMNSSRVAACALRNEQAATLLEFIYIYIFLDDNPAGLESIAVRQYCHLHLFIDI